MNFFETLPGFALVMLLGAAFVSYMTGGSLAVMALMVVGTMIISVSQVRRGAPLSIQVVALGSEVVGYLVAIFLWK